MEDGGVPLPWTAGAKKKNVPGQTPISVKRRRKVGKDVKKVIGT